MFLSSCAKQLPPPIIVSNQIPSELLEKRLAPQPPETLGGFVIYARTLLHIIELSNNDKQAIKAIVSETQR
ncbi:Rz1-like lysis system protein LysC [Budvicia aquatica]|uniref:Rz1-like lysis system protein LysC n=1 Tax=Budvicia aquatica TaxID=82979 RepID=UPI0040397BC6